MDASLTDLIERIEKATGSSRELDAEIFEAFYPDCLFGSGVEWTDSIDAALTLVPDLGEIDGQRLDLFVFAKSTTARCYSDEDTDHKAIAATPALAICAAALRARENSHD